MIQRIFRREGQLRALLASLILVGCGNAYSDVLVQQAEPVCEAGPDCRSCQSDDECPSESPHCNPEGSCVECLDATHCTADSDARSCSAAGRCVECTSDSQCDEDEELCSSELGACLVPCSANVDCGAEEDDEEEEEDEDALACDVAIGFCLECRTDEDCEAGERCIRAECEDSL